MDKILVFSDPHLVAGGETIRGVDPAAALQRAFDHAAAAHPDAVRAVICGDLVQNGTRAEYAVLRPLIDAAPWPVSLMMGNHDLREGFRAVFPEAHCDEAGFIQSTVEVAGTTLILLDTLDEAAVPEHSGVLCDRRLAWLDAALAAAPGDVVVALHHPPVAIGFPEMDAIALRNGAAVMRRLAESGKVRLVLAGHVHRAAIIPAEGLTVALVKSTCFQMLTKFPGPDAPDSAGPPGYSVLALTPEGPVLHHADLAPDAG